MKDNAVRTTLRVRYSEVDNQGIVFNTRYLEYLDVGLTEFLRARGIALREMAERGHFDTALVKSTVEYLGSAQVDQQIDVYAWLARLGTKSFTLGYEICPHDADAPVLVRAELIYVNYSVARRAADPIPDDIRHLLAGGA